MLELPRPVAQLTPTTAVRGTVILSSLYALRTLGLFDRYREVLGDSAAPQVLGVVPGTWVPLEIGFAHYRACDALRLEVARQVEVGSVSGKRSLGAMLGTAVRLSRFVGSTPWTLLEGGNRIWARAYQGGGLRVLRIDERSAIIEVHKNPMFGELAFSRNSVCGFSVALYGLVSQEMAVREVRVTPDRVDLKATWK